MAAPFVHATAVVDDGVHLGDDVKVWHFCHVSSGASLGAGTQLGQNVFVAAGVRLGARVKVQNNVSIYAGVELEDDVFVGPSAVFTNVSTPRAHVSRKAQFETTSVQRGATIGANATIVCGHRIGAYAFVAAGAVVTHDVASHALVMGVPARRVGFVCCCGARLEGHGAVGCGACGARYEIADGACVAGG